MKNICFSGASQTIAGFGHVAQGAVLRMTDAQAEQALLDPEFFEVPTPVQDVLVRTAGLTLDATHNGKLLKFNTADVLTVVLPADPAAGYQVELAHGDTSGGDDITVDPGANEIDGEADYTLTEAIHKKGFYFNGAAWATF